MQRISVELANASKIPTNCSHSFASLFERVFAETNMSEILLRVVS